MSSKPNDPRCPLKMECLPDTFCPLAVQRLKAIRNAGRELTEEEESSLPGCNWAVMHQSSNYCFFKYAADYANDVPPSDNEIAAMLGISVDTVKKTEKNALTKVKESDEFMQIKVLNNDESVMSNHDPDSEHKIYT